MKISKYLESEHSIKLDPSIIQQINSKFIDKDDVVEALRAHFDKKIDDFVAVKEKILKL